MVSWSSFHFTPDEDQPLLFFHTFFLLHSALQHVVLPEALQDKGQHCAAVMVTVLNTKSRFLVHLGAKKRTEARMQRALETRKQEKSSLGICMIRKLQGL